MKALSLYILEFLQIDLGQSLLVFTGMLPHSLSKICVALRLLLF